MCALAVPKRTHLFAADKVVVSHIVRAFPIHVYLKFIQINPCALGVIATHRIVRKEKA